MDFSPGASEGIPWVEGYVSDGSLLTTLLPALHAWPGWQKMDPASLNTDLSVFLGAVRWARCGPKATLGPTLRLGQMLFSGLGSMVTFR